MPSPWPPGPRVSQTPQPQRVLPRQEGGGYFLLLLQQFAEFNELQHEENRQNRQWQYVHIFDCVCVAADIDLDRIHCNT